MTSFLDGPFVVAVYKNATRNLLSIRKLEEQFPAVPIIKWHISSRRVEDSRWLGSLTMVLAGNKAKRLLTVNHTTKTIHHHHQRYV